MMSKIKKHTNETNVEYVARIEADTADLTMTASQRENRMKAGLEVVNAYCDVIKMTRGEIPFPKRDRGWLDDLKNEVQAGDFAYEEDWVLCHRTT